MSDNQGATAQRATVEAAWRLAGYAFLILFLELALIRYVSGYVRVFGFYQNFVLIAAFLGLGAGLLRVGDAPRLRWAFLPLLVVLFATVRFFANSVIEPPDDPNQFVWGSFFQIASTVRRIGILPTVGVLFGLCTLVFVPLGALLGREFRRLSPLHAYSLDIGGGLIGVLAFSALSALRVSPAVWFATGLVLWLLLTFERRKATAGAVVLAALALILVGATAGPRPEFWSPYYRVNVFKVEGAYSIYVNGSFHQYALDLRPAARERDSVIDGTYQSYRLPYRLVSRMDTVLVLGAGTGNDVALLLEAGASYIDAVEIDPVILDLGRAAHFQEPYADARVRAWVDDARAFLHKTDRKYDLIVFGTLDSQTLLSVMSSLRLDNYVYTREAFESARDHLKPDGTLITYHMSGYDYIAAKLYRMIGDAFGEPPVVFNTPPPLFNYVFVAGGSAASAPTEIPAAVRQKVAVPRDDWPYLYLRHRTIPGHYLRALSLVLVLALAMVGWGAGRGGGRGFDWPMFFMGAGFLLVETKSVTEMSLLFGATWRVNLLVFSSVLAMILVANVLVLRGPRWSLRLLFLGLFGALALAYAIPVNSLLILGRTGQWLAGSGMVGLPVVFAAIIFARLFERRADSTRALGANLLGAVVGGVVEYASLVIGVKALYLVAAAAYIGVVASLRKGHFSVSVPDVSMAGGLHRTQSDTAPSAS